MHYMRNTEVNFHDLHGAQTLVMVSYINFSTACRTVADYFNVLYTAQL